MKIIEKEEPVRYPPFRKACTQFSEEEILRMTEGMYLIESKTVKVVLLNE